MDIDIFAEARDIIKENCLTYYSLDFNRHYYGLLVKRDVNRHATIFRFAEDESPWSLDELANDPEYSGIDVTHNIASWYCDDTVTDYNIYEDYLFDDTKDFFKYNKCSLPELCYLKTRKIRNDGNYKMMDNIQLKIWKLMKLWNRQRGVI